MQNIELIKLSLKVFEVMLTKMIKTRIDSGLCQMHVRYINYFNNLFCLICHITNIFVNISKIV